MIKTLARQGNSACLILDRSLMDLLDLENDSAVRITVKGRKMIVEPLSDQERAAMFNKAFSQDREEERQTFPEAGQVNVSPVFLTLDEVLKLHAYQIQEFGGSDKILDIRLLESAIAQPRQSSGGAFLHPGLEDMAAAYLFHIVQNHPFADGNKRTGTHAAIVFLAMNGCDVGELPESAEGLVYAVAKGESDKATIGKYFRDLMG